MRRSLFLLILVFSNLLICQARTQKFEISSPDKFIGLTVEVGKSISYTIKYKEKVLILPSGVNISFQPDSFSGKDKVVTGVSSKYIEGIITPVIKEKRAVIPDIYSELTIRFKNHTSLQFRVYNDGAAYRFSSNLPGDITILSEEAGFNFQPGTTVYYPQVTKRTDADIFHTSFEEIYSKADLDTLSNGMFAFSPVLLKSVNLPAVLITESDVNDYPGMFLGKAGQSGLTGRFAPYPLKEIESAGGFRQKLVVERAPYIARTHGTRTFPWRIIAIAPSDADLLVNDIVYRLAPDPGFTDFGWIKPGKSTEEWITGLNLNKVDFIAGLNTQTYKYYIDFAVRFGFQYVMLDAGWSDVNDLFRITPGMDMEEITGYASKNGIGLIYGPRR
jgi:alpha-glucosidase